MYQLQKKRVMALIHANNLKMELLLSHNIQFPLVASHFQVVLTIRLYGHTCIYMDTNTLNKQKKR
jgi:hypothetical protein